MERRRLLRAAAGVGAAGALGTAAFVASRPSLPPARYLGDAVPRPDGAPVVAADRTERGDHPAGLVWQDATVYDLSENRFRLVSRCVLIPGQNQYQTDWKTAGLTVEHDWGGATFADGVRIESRSADVIPAGREGADRSLGLETGHDDRARRWRLAFDPLTGNTFDYSFATTVELPAAPSAGDPLVRTDFKAEFVGGWFRTETFGASPTLSVGDESGD